MPWATMASIRSPLLHQWESGSPRQLSINLVNILKFAVQFTRFFNSHFPYVQINLEILIRCLELHFQLSTHDIAGALKEKKSVKKGLTGL